MGETKIYSADEIQNALIADVIKEVASILEEKGYNPINQIVGYLMSGDPGYISSYKDARKKISKLDRTKILNVLVSDFVK
ncbi:MAG: IreB family regulatory phosphoprotein [Firmicutes bacterium]|nr:IreB family regulatory phosphoprotein [Bacillota bacterium]